MRSEFVIMFKIVNYVRDYGLSWSDSVVTVDVSGRNPSKLDDQPEEDLLKLNQWIQ